MIRMIPALLVPPILLALSSEGGAQASGPSSGVSPPAEAPSRGAVEACGHDTCSVGVVDQASGHRCIRASSKPTFELLFPYPGIDNTFVGPAFVGGGEDNLAVGPWSTVGGGRGNTASYYSYGYGGGEGYSTVAGGVSNTASGNSSTVGGGAGNDASGRGCTVGGGLGNAAVGFESPPAGIATVAGGSQNTAWGWGSAIGGGSFNYARHFAVVAGGTGNIASGDWSSITGGLRNVAGGRSAMVPGGSDCEAQGFYSFAAGRRAMAVHDGAFVWGDSVAVDKPSSAADEFTVYASGGVRMFTNSAATTGAALAPGSGTWSMLSDQDAKENVELVDVRAVLEGVVALPLSTWNYTEQSDEIRHLGPMAQDFRAAFGLGVNDKLIDAVDSDGVALAAIQGLHALLREKDAEIAALREENDAQIAELRERLDRLEAKAAR